MALVLFAGACGDPSTVDDDAAASRTHTLTGDISIEGVSGLSRIPSTRMEVRLQDVSYQDAPSVLIAEQIYEGVTTLPLTYELTWVGELDPRNDYSVAASGYDEHGQLIFVNDTAFPGLPGRRQRGFPHYQNQLTSTHCRWPYAPGPGVLPVSGTRC